MELYGRKVVDVEVDGIDMKDYPDFCDAYFSSAIFEDTLEELTDDQLDELRELYPSELLEEVWDRCR